VASGNATRPEFRPFVRDVHDFVDRTLADAERDRETGSWTPDQARARAYCTARKW
jgi:hypothetical protein